MPPKKKIEPPPLILPPEEPEVPASVEPLTLDALPAFSALMAPVSPGQVTVPLLLAVTLEALLNETPPAVAPASVSVIDTPWPQIAPVASEASSAETLTLPGQDKLLRGLHNLPDHLAMARRVLEAVKLPIGTAAASSARGGSTASSLTAAERQVAQGRALGQLPGVAYPAVGDRLLVLREFEAMLQPLGVPGLSQLYERRFSEHLPESAVKGRLLQAGVQLGEAVVVSKYVESMDAWLVGMAGVSVVGRVGWAKFQAPAQDSASAAADQLTQKLAFPSDGSIIVVDKIPGVPDTCRVHKDGFTLTLNSRGVFSLFDGGTGKQPKTEGFVDKIAKVTIAAKEVSGHSSAVGSGHWSAVKEMAKSTAAAPETDAAGARITAYVPEGDGPLQFVYTSKLGEVLRMVGGGGVVEWSLSLTGPIDTATEWEICRSYTSRCVVREVRLNAPGAVVRTEVMFPDGTFAYRHNVAREAAEAHEWTVVTIEGKRHLQKRSPVQSLALNSSRVLPAAAAVVPGLTGVYSNELGVYVVKQATGQHPGGTTTALFPDGTRIQSSRGRVVFSKADTPVVTGEQEQDGREATMEVKLLEGSSIRVTSRAIRLSKGDNEISVDRRAGKVTVAPYVCDLRNKTLVAQDDARNDFRWDANVGKLEVKLHVNLGANLETPREVLANQGNNVLVLPPDNKYLTVAPRAAEPRLFVIHKGDAEEIMTRHDAEKFMRKKKIPTNLCTTQPLTGGMGGCLMHHLLAPGYMSNPIDVISLDNTVISQKVIDRVNRQPKLADFNVVRSMIEYPELLNSEIRASAISNQPAHAGKSLFEIEARALKLAHARLGVSVDVAKLWEAAPKCFPPKVLEESPSPPTPRPPTPPTPRPIKKKVSRPIRSTEEILAPLRQVRNFWQTELGLDFQMSLGTLKSLPKPFKKEKLPKLATLNVKSIWEPELVDEIPTDQASSLHHVASPTPVAPKHPLPQRESSISPDFPRIELPGDRPGPHPGKKAVKYNLYGELRQVGKSAAQIELEPNAKFQEIEADADRKLRTVSVVHKKGARYPEGTSFESSMLGLEGSDRLLDVTPIALSFGSLSVGGVYRMTVLVRNLDVDVARFNARVDGNIAVETASVRAVYTPGPLAPGIVATVAAEIAAKRVGDVQCELVIVSKGAIARVPVTAAIVDKHAESQRVIRDAIEEVKPLPSVGRVTDAKYIKRVMSTD